MRTLLSRGKLSGLAAMMLTANVVDAAEKPSANRAEYKKNFTNGLVSMAEDNFMVMPIDDVNIHQEAEALAHEMADTIVNTLIEKSLRLGALRPNKNVMTRAYHETARQELGNNNNRYVPVGLHCMRGAYTAILNGVNALQIDPEIVPSAAQDACKAFRYQMKTRYNGPEYQGCLYDKAKIYKDKDVFDATLAKFIANASGGANKDTIALVNKFKQKNIYIDELGRGTVLLVPRSKDEFHAISYIGRGYLDEDGNFVPDNRKEPFYAAFNVETIAELFKDSNTLDIPFVANIHKITVVSLIKESEKFNSMDQSELIEYLAQNDESQKNVQPFLSSIRHEALVKLALSKYFGNDFVRREKMTLINPYPIKVALNQYSKTL